jgi:Trypsin-like peptidase domain/Effector-associated domain 1
MPVWNQTSLINLRWILANLYPMLGDGMRLAVDAELSVPQIRFSDKAITNWFEILERARIEKKVDRIVQCAVAENPDNESLRAAQQGTPPPSVEGPEPKHWRSTKSERQLEKIIGQRSTLVSISYLQQGIERAKPVVRVKRANGSSGTGFVVGGNTLITNNHVLPSVTAAASSLVQFNYQKTVDGLDSPIDEFDLAPNELFLTSELDDWTAVRIRGGISKWGELALRPIDVAVGDHVNIIQHPGGGQKQISFVANVVTFVGAGRVQYLTDTLPGSSGSPVFDTEWNVVAIHHSGGWLTEPNAPFKSTYYRNEGISIQRLIDGLSTQ